MCTSNELACLAWETVLADTYPGYRFARSEAGSRRRWSAVALHPGTHPWCVVTRDPREFAPPSRPSLARSGRRPGSPSAASGTSAAKLACGFDYRLLRFHWALAIPYPPATWPVAATQSATLRLPSL